MNARDRRAQELATRIRHRFPAQPIPAYPPLMGLDPLGVTDEYAGFADLEWHEIPPQNFRSTGYDISPAIGFRLHDTPHMWNYCLPGFMTASLLHEAEHDVTDGFLWNLREVAPEASGHQASLPWWSGKVPAENYTREQDACVVQYLEFMRELGGGEPYGFVWEPEDECTLERWLARG